MKAEQNSYKVYKHTTPSGKVYIGITSKRVEERWLNGRGYVRNKHFYSAIKKYGWSNIKHEVICSGLTREAACKEEKFYICLYNSNCPEHGYNLTSGGESGAVHNEESRLKLSASKKGKRYNIGVPFTEERKKHLRENHADVSGKNNPNYGKKWTKEEIAKRQANRVYKYGDDNPCSRAILQMSKDGEIVARWPSISEASKHYCKTSIKYCLSGKYKQHRGYIWRYEDGQRT